MGNQVTDHYSSDNLGIRIAEAIQKAGKDPDHLQIKDLSVIDQLHTGGHMATLALGKKIGLTKNLRVLDAGCGIGGSSRLLAEAFQCHVTGIDLVPAFIDVARMLSLSTGMDGAVTFFQGDVINTGLENQSFDVVLSQHILMNIGDKNAAFAEFFRVLKPGGVLVVHEIVRGAKDTIHLPVPWADKPSISLLETWETLQELIQTNGFICQNAQDQTDQAKAWWYRVKAAMEKTGDKPRPLGPHIIFGANGKFFEPNMSANLEEDRIRMVEAICKKSI